MKNKKSKVKGRENIVPIQVKGTVYNIHPAVLGGINNLTRQYEGMVTEYKTILSMNQMHVGHFKRVIALFDNTELSEDQRLIINELKELTESKEQTKNDNIYNQLLEFNKSRAAATELVSEEEKTDADAPA